MKIAPKIIVCDNRLEAEKTAENICLIYPWKTSDVRHDDNYDYIVIIDHIKHQIDAELWYF